MNIVQGYRLDIYTLYPTRENNYCKYKMRITDEVSNRHIELGINEEVSFLLSCDMIQKAVCKLKEYY